MRKLLLFSFSFAALSCNNDDKSIETSSNYNIEHPVYFGTKYNTPFDNPITKEGFELGRLLFYDTILSFNRSVSCASCHQQQFAFSDNRRLSTGALGMQTKRNSMSIVNLIWQDKFFWDGRVNTLEEQAINPITSPFEMNMSLDTVISRLENSTLYQEKFESTFGSSQITVDRLVKAIGQFERALISGNSKFDLYKKGLYKLSPSEKRGEKLFYTHPEPSVNLRGGNCGDCHSGFLTTDNSFRNNGLPFLNTEDLGVEETSGNRLDRRKFKTVSLRNISLTAPYMHDGRFNTLEEVLDHYNDHINSNENTDPLIMDASNSEGKETLGLSAEEKKDIIKFLHLLTDDEFLTNEKFSNPFK